jgi:hypothetical protein
LILAARALPDRRSTAAIVLAIVAMGCAMFALQSACYPWAHSPFGPTLTGTWLGEMTPDPQRQFAFLELLEDIGDAGGPDLNGTVRLCDERGRMHRLGVSGNTHNWRGTAFSFTTFTVDGEAGNGIRLRHAEGRWDRRDSLRVTATLATGSDRGSAPLVEFTLTRGSEREFQTACAGAERS